MNPTKRNAVQTVGRIYDPLGMLTPGTVNFKFSYKTSTSLR
jgi:hypothetical protein